jgi:hypothetical protein
MRRLFPSLFTAAALVAAIAVPLSAMAQAQAFAGNDSGKPNASTKSKDKDKRKGDAKDAAKVFNAQVRDGVLTVDGFVAKLKLNYDLVDANFLYFYVPQVGTAVVSLGPQPNAAIIEKAAFHGNTLTFSAGGHTFELTNANPMVSGKTADAYVHFDAATTALDRYPMMGFGNTVQAPYSWPAALAMNSSAEQHYVEAPPLPRSLLPRTAGVATSTVPAVVPVKSTR